MKQLFFGTIVLTLLAGACKSKKQAAAPAAPVADPNQNQLTAVQAKLPNSTMEDLQKGHDVFYGACTKCHGVKDMTEFDEPGLQKIMNKMSNKAHLTDPEKDAVWKYALALNLTGKK